MSDENPDELIRDKRYDHIFAALAAPFDEGEVRTRPQGGKQIRYITARTAMNRLDDVIGAGFWWDDYTPGENSVMCRLTIELPDGRKITKVDAGGYAGMPDSGDDDKSGFSDGLKRAAAKFGVARSLYGDGMPHNVREAQGEVIEPPKERRDWQTAHRGPTHPEQRHGEKQVDRAPDTGRSLFAWVKKQEEQNEVGLLKYLNSWSKLQDWPGRMVDWDREQVALAYTEATRKLQSIAQGSTEAYEEALSNN